MVCHIGEKKRINIEESERREKGADKKKEGQKRRPAPPPDSEKDGEGHDERKAPEAPPKGHFNVPFGVDEGELRGPEQLAQVKPYDPPCEKAAFQWPEVKGLAAGSNVGALDPGREEARKGPEGIPRGHGQDVAPP